MSEAVPPAPVKGARLILLDAIEWAIRQGFTVVADAREGVFDTGREGRERWARINGEGINPLGAAILQHQPEVSRISSAARRIDNAAWMATHTSICWVEGFSVGIAGLAAPSNWREHIAYGAFIEAHRLGLEMRGLLADPVVCRHHNVQYTPGSGCQRCAMEDVEPTKPDTRPESERR